MENKCSKCGGKVQTGRLQAGRIVIEFTPLEDEKKFKQRCSTVLCDACAECGAIGNIRLENPEKLQ